jgi:hypothetical protein
MERLHLAAERTDMTAATPPRWAEVVLRSVLARHNRDAVSGDLLEQYRDAVVPNRGERAADRWYVRQVANFVARSSMVWALLFSGAFLARQVFDAMVPTTDFHVRAEVTTYTAISLLLAAGFWTAWQSGSILGGVLTGLTTTAIAAVISDVGGAALLAIWQYDPDIMRNIRNSGGVAEMFVLPVFALALGTVLGTVGGAVGASARAIWRVTLV